MKQHFNTKSQHCSPMNKIQPTLNTRSPQVNAHRRLGSTSAASPGSMTTNSEVLHIEDFDPTVDHAFLKDYLHPYLSDLYHDL